jgi:hypothetical protein
MPIEMRRGLYIAPELDEVSGNRTDAFHGWTYTDTNSVGQTSAGVTQLD